MASVKNVRLMPLFCGFLIIFNIIFIAMIWNNSSRSTHPQPDEPMHEMLYKFRDMLSLSQQQFDSLIYFHHQFVQERNKYNLSILKLRGELTNLAFSEQPDSTGMNLVISKISETHMVQDSLLCVFFSKVRFVMTPEQCRKFEHMLHEAARMPLPDMQHDLLK